MHNTQNFKNKMNCQPIKTEFIYFADSVCVNLKSKTDELFTAVFWLSISSFTMFLVSLIVIGIYRPDTRKDSDEKQQMNQHEEDASNEAKIQNIQKEEIDMKYNERYKHESPITIIEQDINQMLNYDNKYNSPLTVSSYDDKNSEFTQNFLSSV